VQAYFHLVFAVLNQNTHHHKKTFREEYLEMLDKFEISYKDEYVFDFFNDVDYFG
jgi:hypothetical protein